jgi:hypothetical protein
MLQFKSPSKFISFCSESSIWFINIDTNSLKIFRRDMIQVVIAGRVIYENTNPTSVSIAMKTNYQYHNLEYLRDRQKWIDLISFH